VIAEGFIESWPRLLEMICWSIWSGIDRRFILYFLPSTLGQRLLSRELWPTGKLVDGIASHLTAKCNGNIHDNGIVNGT
jgi:hypothetical protein